MPDILVVPDDWTWSGLIKNDMILPASDFDEFDFADRKWNKSYKAMTTFNNDIYGMFAGPTLNSTGLFVNKPLLESIGVSENLMALQQDGAWDWNKLEEIADTFNTSLHSQNKYLFAGTEEMFRQMLHSNDAAPTSIGKINGNTFKMNTPTFKQTAQLYTKMYKSGLIAEKAEDESDDWYIQQFSKGNILFMVKPYDQTVDQLKVEYKKQDATVDWQNGNFLGQPGKVPVIIDATETVFRDGEYVMPSDHWEFLLFPKGPSASDYAAMINQPSYPVMLASAANPSDAAYVWNQLSEEFTGVEYTRFLKKYLNQRSADLNTLKRIGLKNGVWDVYSGTGAWDTVIEPDLMPLLKTGEWKTSDLAKLNAGTKKYVSENLKE